MADGWKLLTIFAKRVILDVWQCSECAFEFEYKEIWNR